MSFQCESNTDFKQIFILRRSKKRHLCGDWKHTEDIQKNGEKFSGCARFGVQSLRKKYTDLSFLDLVKKDLRLFIL